MKVSKAIVNDRRVKIMRLIEEKRSVSVDELVEKYHVFSNHNSSRSPVLGRQGSRLSGIMEEHR